MVALFNQVEQVYIVSQNYHFVHDELPKLVVDIECRGSKSEPIAP